MSTDRFELAVARRIKDRRKELDVSQQTVADRMQQQGHNWLQPTVAKTENMRRPLYVAELPALAEALRTSVAALLGLNEPDECNDALADTERRIRESFGAALTEAIARVIGAQR